MITIGIDPHKASHTAVALKASGAALAELRVVADASMLGALQRWAAVWPQRVWAIEGASGLGRLLAQQLVAAGESVLDVPAALAARSRAGTWSWPQDRRDRRAQRRSGCPAARRPTRGRRRDHSSVLRLLSDRRDELTGERRPAINGLHRRLRDLHPGGAPRRSKERSERSARPA